MKHQKMKRRVIPALGSALVLAMSPNLAQAFKFSITDDVQASFDSTFSYGISMRMQDRSCHLIARDNGGCAAIGAELPEGSEDAFFINTDNGDLNYNQHDIFSQVIKGTHELFVKAPNDWTGFVRFTESYDFSVDHTRRTELNGEARGLAVHNFQMLDLYVSKNFDLYGHNTRIRVGNQVISWGESTFVLGGINWANSIDVRRAHVPGTQLKEIFRPAPMITLSADVIDNVSFEGFWQWKWNGFQLDPTGTYFSSADIAGKGNDGAIFLPTSAINAGVAADDAGALLLAGGLVVPAAAGTVGDPGGTGLTKAQLMTTAAVGPRLIDGFSGLQHPGDPDTPASLLRRPFATVLVNAALATGTALPLESMKEPRSNGQFGLSFHYSPEWTDASFGIYYLNYSEKIPFISYVVDPKYASNNPVSAAYKIEFPKNRELIGVSTNFNAGDWAIGAEVSYRPREATAIDPSVPTTAGKQPKYACVTDGGEANGHYCKGWVNEQKWQTQSTALQIMSPTSGIGQWILPILGASEGVFLAEAGVTYFPGLKPLGGIPWSLPAYAVPDKVSAGYVISSSVTYPNAFNSGFNWSPQIDWSHGVYGNSPNAIPWQGGAKAATATLNLNRQNRITTSLAYTWYTGGGSQNMAADRDFVSLSAAYNF
ncbi:MAG: DUF1302 domain-containing protein [Pseudomonadota bacterium]